MTPSDILDFWFAEATKPKWFNGGAAFDDEVRTRFAAEYAAATRGAYDGWCKDAQSALALVIVLDQFPRNMFRSSARAFATDDQALKVAGAAIDAGFDDELADEAQHFLYMPFMHAEDLAAQDRGVALFEALGDAGTLAFMKQHRDIVARFGRFPHRNAVLGRASTAEEIAAGAVTNPF